MSNGRGTTIDTRGELNELVRRRAEIAVILFNKYILGFYYRKNSFRIQLYNPYMTIFSQEKNANGELGQDMTS